MSLTPGHIVYEVSVDIDPDMANDWLRWMQQTHIPDVMETACFTSYHMSRVLDPDTSRKRYVITYVCPDMATFTHYQQSFAPALQKDHTDRYSGRFQATRRLSQIVDSS